MERPTTSIVILARNELEVTRACVDSIAQCTPEPHELVFVDNGSSDGTREYLATIPGAVVIRNERNLGFGGGCNQGIAASLGQRILLLNNDVVVTPGWLGALHDAFDADPNIGLVGPRSNRVAGVQQVPAVGYDEEQLIGLDAWAQDWTDSHRGAVELHLRIVGFCVLIERAVIERIGGFDLRYGIGNFEDDDLCLRAAVGGFACAIAHGAFVHHIGSRTFAAEGIDYHASMAENLGHFAAAWDMDESDIDFSAGSYRVDRVVARAVWDEARHYAPLVAVPDQLARIELDARTEVVAVCCDRLDPDATDASLRAALQAFGPLDDVTIAVRIDPRDQRSSACLDAIADEIGDAVLPDVAIVEASDDDDLPLLRRADRVVVHGRLARARASLARVAGAVPVTIEELRTPEVMS